MNQTCHPIEPEELMAYLDGELPAKRATAAAAHLGKCTECQHLVAELRAVSQSLKNWKIEAPESEMPPVIANALAQNREPSPIVAPVRRHSWREIFGLRWSTFAWAGGVAGVILVVYGTMTFYDVGIHEYKMAPPPRDTAMLVTPESARETAPPIASTQRRDFDKKSEMSAMLRSVAPGVFDQPPSQSAVEHGPVISGPMIVRTAQLSLITREFDKMRANLEAILKRHRGFVGELKVGGTTGSGRTLTATLRVPADQLDAALTEAKTLGRVESESQSGQDVTSEYVDLQARLANSRNTEQRLTDLLRHRTGKLADVLEVEQELDRIRGEIEQMEAQRKNMTNQVSYATLNATITEDYQSQLQIVPPSTSTRLGNAAVEGYRSMVDGVMSLILFVLENGPSLLLWCAILLFPARFAWKKARRSLAS